MDDFERELRIGNLEQCYEIATAALRRAQVELQMLRADRRSAPTLIEKAERRCQELARRRRALRHVLDELEDEDRASVSAHRSTPELRPR
jgi:chromosome segregation ATPase